MSMRLPAFTRYALVLFAGPLVWAVHFLAIYGFAGVVCARPALQAARWGVPLLVWGVLGAGVLALAVLALAMRARPRAPEEGAVFLRRVSAGLAWLAVAAIGWESTVVLFFPRCGAGA